MDENQWYKPTSKVRNMLGIFFVIIAFIWMTVFYVHVSSAYPNTTPNMLTIWLGIMITSFLFFIGFYIGFNIKTKEAITGFLILTVWSLLFFIPLPKDYGEYVVTGYFFLLCGILMLYIKYKESKKKKAQVGKEMEKE